VFLPPVLSPYPNPDAEPHHINLFSLTQSDYVLYMAKIDPLPKKQTAPMSTNIQKEVSMKLLE
jgi:hypothetical protein